MSALRKAASRRLCSDLASHRFWTRIPERAFTPSLPETGPLIEALVAIGGLTAAEAATWRARFERAATPPAPDPALRARAREHLATLRDRRGEGDEVDRFDAAVEAYSGVGLITPQEAAEWRGESEQPQPGRTGLYATLDDDESRFDDSVLRAVRLGPELRVAGLRVTVLELYERAVVIQWHYSATAGEDPAADALWQRLGVDGFDEELVDEMDDDEWFDDDDPIRLADDVGTRYRSWTGGWSVGDGSARIVRGHSGFGPGVPATASRLEILVEGEAIPLDLG